MSIYLVLWGVLLFIVTGPVSFNASARKITFGIITITLVVIVGLRERVGGDWDNYIIIQEGIDGLSLMQSLLVTDPAYGVLNWLANQWGLGIYPVNLVCAIFFMVGLAKFSLAQPKPWLAMAVAMPYLLTAVAMGYTRQSAALGFVFMALVALCNGQQRNFILLVLCGILFHKSAVIVYFLLPLSMPKIRIWRLLVIGAVIIVFSGFFMMDSISGMWGLYVEQSMESDGGLLRILLNIIPAFILIFAHKRWFSRWPNDYQIWLWISIASILCLPMLSFASTATDRIALYLAPLQLAVYSRLPLLFEGVWRGGVLISILLFYSSIYFVWLFFSPWAQCCWVPYNNILFLN